MAEKKISQLINATTPLTGTEEVPLVQNGVTKKVLVSEFGGSTAWGDITGTLSSQTDLNTALNAKEPTITSGTTAQYYRGDKTFQTLDKNAVGLGNVDNTSDLSKPISTATQTALDTKQATLVSGTSIKTINGNSVLGSGNLTIGGSSNPSVVGIQSGNATTVNTAGVSISKTFTIPANTLASSCVLELTARVVRLSGSSSNFFIQIYHNTSNSLTGATLIGKSTVGGTTTNFMQIERTYNINASTFYAFSGSSQALTDTTTNTVSVDSSAFNVASTQYILVAISNSSTDSLVCNQAKLIQNA